MKKLLTLICLLTFWALPANADTIVIGHITHSTLNDLAGAGSSLCVNLGPLGADGACATTHQTVDSISLLNVQVTDGFDDSGCIGAIQPVTFNIPSIAGGSTVSVVGTPPSQSQSRVCTVNISGTVSTAIIYFTDGTAFQLSSTSFTGFINDGGQRDVPLTGTFLTNPPSETPEPATLVMMMTGLGSMASVRRFVMRR